jgi:DegV family protein with EDD domain
MQFVTDSGTDLFLTPEQLSDLNIQIVPLKVTLDGKSYQEGVDIQPDEFYRLLAASDDLPTTSLPSAGEFADLYRRLGTSDPDIMSIHMSSGLSGTFNAAQAGAALIPDLNITVVDTKTLSTPAGWQVEAAAQAGKAGWSVEQILPLLDGIRDATDTSFTLKELKYLIHGGRISHMKGLVASLLNIKPLIGVEPEGGTYEQLGQVRSFNKAVTGLVDLIAKKHPPGSALRVQVVHTQNPEGADMLREQINQRFECTWLPIVQMSLVLGAHTGPSMIGVGCAEEGAFSDLP